MCGAACCHVSSYESIGSAREAHSCWWALYRTATHYTTLHSSARYCNSARETGSCSWALRHSATYKYISTARERHWCSWALQHFETHCNLLQHTATNCITLHHTAPHRTTLQRTAANCTTRHHTENAYLIVLLHHVIFLFSSQRCAVHCSALQCVVVRCSAL